MAVYLPELITGSKELDLLFSQIKDLPKAYSKILARGINRASKGVVTDSVKLLSSRYRKKQIVFKNAFSVYQANPKKLFSRVKAVGKKAEHLSDWNAKQTNKGVTFRILKEGKKRFIPGAFIVKGKNSHKPIVVIRKTSERYPLKTLYSTTGFEVLNNQQMQTQILAGARERLLKNVMADTKHTLNKIAEAVKT